MKFINDKNRIIAVLLTICMVMASCSVVFAADSQINVAVPDTHSFTVNCGNATYTVSVNGGTMIKHGNTYTISRGAEVFVNVSFGEAYQLGTVSVSGMPSGWSINTIVGTNTIQFPSLSCDLSINIEIKKKGSDPIPPGPYYDHGDGTSSRKYKSDAAYRQIAHTQFDDVTSDAYYAAAVGWAVDEGITSGFTKSLFAPNAGCTRAQFVTFLYRAAGSPKINASAHFEDVEKGSFYEKAVAWGYANNIVAGITDKQFGPDIVITRAQAVAFMYRYYLSVDGGSAVVAQKTFDDVELSDYYSKAVTWAAKEGITVGETARTFAPGKDCLRAQMITFLYRYFVRR